MLSAERLFTIAITALLTACASAPPPQAPRGADPFVERKLTPRFLAPAVAAKIPADANNPRFGTITIATASTLVENSGRTEFSNTTLRFTNVGNGLLQRVSELTRYETSYGATYSLSYKGLIDLKFQEVPLRTTIVRPVIEMKTATRFDALPTEPGRELTIDYSTGLENQTSNFLPIRFSCRSTRKLLANSLNAKIPGEALELDCRLVNNNNVQSGSKWMVLLAYGIAIEVEHTRSTNRVLTRIVDINVAPIPV